MIAIRARIRLNSFIVPNNTMPVYNVMRSKIETCCCQTAHGKCRILLVTASLCTRSQATRKISCSDALAALSASARGARTLAVSPLIEYSTVFLRIDCIPTNATTAPCGSSVGNGDSSAICARKLSLRGAAVTCRSFCTTQSQEDNNPQ